MVIYLKVEIASCVFLFCSFESIFFLITVDRDAFKPKKNNTVGVFGQRSLVTCSLIPTIPRVM